MVDRLLLVVLFAAREQLNLFFFSTLEQPFRCPRRPVIFINTFLNFDSMWYFIATYEDADDGHLYMLLSYNVSLPCLMSV